MEGRGAPESVPESVASSGPAPERLTPALIERLTAAAALLRKA